MSKVLLVDDNRSQLELMDKFLTVAGHTSVRITDAKEAVNKALEYKPDIIVTDVVMPGMSGFELCRRLKQNPGTSGIPIVICSSKDQEIDRLWGMRQGAKAYLTKPFSQEDFLRTLNLAMI